jgi:peptidylprolyl isomerase
MPQVKQGSTVLVHYTAMLKNGEVIESTAGGDPLRITVGAGKVMRGFEEALVTPLLTPGSISVP